MGTKKENQRIMNWIRRSLTRDSRNSQNPNPQSKSNPNGQDEEQVYGITEELINFVKSFTIDTFKNFPFQGKLFFRSFFMRNFYLVVGWIEENWKKIMDLWVIFFISRKIRHVVFVYLSWFCLFIDEKVSVFRREVQGFQIWWFLLIRETQMI